MQDSSLFSDEEIAGLLRSLREDQQTLTQMKKVLRQEVGRSGPNSKASLALVAARKVVQQRFRNTHSCYHGLQGKTWNNNRKYALHQAWLAQRAAPALELVLAAPLSQ